MRRSERATSVSSIPSRLAIAEPSQAGFTNLVCIASFQLQKYLWNLWTLLGTKQVKHQEPESWTSGRTDEVACIGACALRGSQTIIAIRDALIEIDTIGFPRTRSLCSRSDRPSAFVVCSSVAPTPPLSTESTATQCRQGTTRTEQDACGSHAF